MNLVNTLLCFYWSNQCLHARCISLLMNGYQPHIKRTKWIENDNDAKWRPTKKQGCVRQTVNKKKRREKTWVDRKSELNFEMWWQKAEHERNKTTASKTDQRSKTKYQRIPTDANANGRIIEIYETCTQRQIVHNAFQEMTLTPRSHCSFVCVSGTLIAIKSTFRKVKSNRNTIGKWETTDDQTKWKMKYNSCHKCSIKARVKKNAEKMKEKKKLQDDDRTTDKRRKLLNRREQRCLKNVSNSRFYDRNVRHENDIEKEQKWQSKEEW